MSTDLKKIDPRLHHVCLNVTQGSLENVVKVFELLDCKVVYNPDAAERWVMVGQSQLRFAIQIAEVSEKPLSDIDIKKRVHIAFISRNPQSLIDTVKSWADREGIKFREGGWSGIERFFDLPDIFVNFVVEVMHTSIEK